MKAPSDCFYSRFFKTINLSRRPTASSKREQIHNAGERQRQSPVSTPGPEDRGEGAPRSLPQGVIRSYLVISKEKNQQTTTKLFCSHRSGVCPPRWVWGTGPTTAQGFPPPPALSRSHWERGWIDSAANETGSGPGPVN